MTVEGERRANDKPWRVDVLECRGSSYDVGKQMAEGFLKTPRGRAYGRRRERRPSLQLRNAQAALQTYAPTSGRNCTAGRRPENPPRARGAEYSNAACATPRGCSAVMSGGLYGRNYDYDVGHYDRSWSRSTQGVNAASASPTLHQPPRRPERTRALRRPASGQQRSLATEPRLHLIVRMVLDNAPRRATHRLARFMRGYNYSDGRRRHGGGRRAAPAAWRCAKASSWAAAIISFACAAGYNQAIRFLRHLPPLESCRQQLPDRCSRR